MAQPERTFTLPRRTGSPRSPEREQLLQTLDRLCHRAMSARKNGFADLQEEPR